MDGGKNVNTDNKADIPAQDTQNAGKSKHDNPFSVYAVASQVGFMVIVPLLLFIWGGSWLVNKFALPGWLMIVFVFLGIFVMIASVTNYLYRMIKMYGGSQKPDRTNRLSHDVRDHDYYDDEYR